MITLENTDSKMPFEEIFKYIDAAQAGWGEVTQGQEEWAPDKRTLKVMYDAHVLNIVNVYRNKVLCGHIIFNKQRQIFNVNNIFLHVLSLYIYPEYRKFNVGPNILRYLKNQARKQKCKGVVLAIPAYLRGPDKLNRFLGRPVDYLYKLGL